MYWRQSFFFVYLHLGSSLSSDKQNILISRQTLNIKYIIMENETKSIHEFDFNLICEYFSSIDRQGPGSPEATRKALSFVDGLTHESRIADLGCGTGGQTMVLAQSAPGRITGIDLFPRFIDLFNSNADQLNLQERVKGIVGSMEELPFEENELDLIWSEGAIYNIGFQRGITEWRKFLKPGGYIAVSEASWFTVERPDEIHDFWNNAYPEIDLISNKVAQLEKAGYVVVGTFVIPESCWIDHYYAPQVAAQENFLKKYSGDKFVEEFVQSERHEADLYRKYKSYYGYVFYIGKKID